MNEPRRRGNERVAAWLLFAALSSSFGCSSRSSYVIDGGGSDVDRPDADAIPRTEACVGRKSLCLAGTVTAHDFKASPMTSQVALYRVFPHGDAAFVDRVPVALDGTFAFSKVPAWGHYYLEAQATFVEGTNAHTVASITGSFTVPASGAPIPLVVRPVFIEVLQQASPSAATTLTWASAHIYDPMTGAEVKTGTVFLSANGKTVPMTYGVNAAGMESFFATVPAKTPGGTSFKITTSYRELGSAPVTWNLVGDPETFQGSIVSPKGVVPADKPLEVTWVKQQDASYSYTITELFQVNGSAPVLRYASQATAPDQATDTIPGSDLASTGTYLLNESYVDAMCPVVADGCVYNAWTAAETLTAD
jgi:hypothetical protein